MYWRRLVRFGMLDDRIQETKQELQDNIDELEQALQQSIKRQDFYTGVTDASGLWSVTFLTPFPNVPHVNAEIVNPDDQTAFRFLSITAVGFSMHVYRRTSVNVLGLQVPNFTVVNVVGQACTAAAFQRVT